MNRLLRRAAASLLIFAFFFPASARAGTPLLIPVHPTIAKSGDVPVRLNVEALKAVSPGGEVDLVLPNGSRHTYLYEHTVSHGGGFNTWIARSPLTGDNERAVITFGPSGAWGWMKTADGDFRLYPSGKGYDLLAPRPKMDYSPKFAGGDAILVGDDSAQIEPLKGIPTVVQQPKSAFGFKTIPTPTVQSDVMIIYTKDLADKLGAGLMPMLYNLIASSNQAYVDSEIAISLRLVYATQLDYPNANGSSATLNGMAGSGAFAAPFQTLTWGVGSIRDTVGADFVALVRDGPEDTGGIGNLPKNPTIYPGVLATQTTAYSVNNYCASGCEGIFVHELGHNMGDHHDVATIAKDGGTGAVNETGVFSYSYGYYSCAGGLTCNPFVAGNCTEYAGCVAGNANDFGSVMSYISPKLMKFSNPLLSDCVPTGGNAGAPRACGGASVAPAPATTANNALSMNQVRGNISAYRTQTIASLPGSIQFTALSYSGTEGSGTLTFTVSRASGTAGAVSVTYTVSGGTATAAVDFAVASGTLNWADGDGANKTFNVTLTNDLATEGVESLVATLSSVSGATGIYLGAPATATGLIVEGWPVGTAGLLPTSPVAWTSPAASSVPWAIVTDSAPAGDADGLSLKSGAINFSVKNCNDAVYLAIPCPSMTEFTANFVAGIVAYAYRVSSFPSNGFLEFLIDGTVVQSASGTSANTSADTGWLFFSAPIAAGTHTLRWQFRPRFSFPCSQASSGGNPPTYPGCMDRAWIDQLSLPLALTNSSTAVASSLNPANAGQSVTFTATVSATGTPAGTVAFRDGASTITGCSAQALTSGTATCSTSALTAGSHSITAAYSGSTTHAASISSALTQTVNSVTNVALTVTKSGAGTGTVTSSPAGINCGGTCTTNFTSGTAVTLTAASDAGSLFVGWSGGGCSGTGTCQVTLNAATTVTADFAVQAATPTGSALPTSLDFGGQSMQTTSAPLTVTLTNVGTGTLTISGATVSAGYAQTNNCTSLAAAVSCTATVTFTPTTQGAVAGTLTFQTSAGDVAVTLAGTGERSLVTHYYRAILNRAPDGPGKTFWESEAARLSALGVNINETWYVMAGYFFNSAEYLAANKTNDQFVADLYNTFFNRPPDAGGQGYWVSQIVGGLPREVVLFSFMFSTEFRTFTEGIFGNTAARPEVDMVVDFFRGLLNRLPDTASFNYWLGQLRTAQCAGAGPVYTAVDQISAAFMFNPEYANRARNNTQFVTDMYYSFLRRGGDVAGVQYWINELNTGARYPNDVRYFGFLNGAEFGARVQAVIAAGCLP